MNDERPFTQKDGIFVPLRPPQHRNDEYDEATFEILLQMQREHFWYRGRHLLLKNVLDNALRGRVNNASDLSAIDLGGGCGGWIEYLHQYSPGLFEELALGDSSLTALSLAEPVVGSSVRRYQVDLLDLKWHEKWDVVFLLDVLEHIPDHEHVLREIHKVLKPGGLLFLTVPALKQFWTYNDDIVHHQRRYSKKDIRILAQNTHFSPLKLKYFMFFLSPALLLSRLLLRPPKSATAEQRHEHLLRTHAIPAKPLNDFLTKLFAFEVNIAGRLAYPWGTSLLALLQRQQPRGVNASSLATSLV